MVCQLVLSSHGKVATGRIKSCNQKIKGCNQKVAKKIAKKIVENDELDDQQQKFCVYFVKYHNATKAYQLAYGAKYTSAMVMACNLRKEPKIQEEIKRLKEIMYRGYSS